MLGIWVNTHPINKSAIRQAANLLRGPGRQYRSGDVGDAGRLPRLPVSVWILDVGGLPSIIPRSGSVHVPIAGAHTDRGYMGWYLPLEIVAVHIFVGVANILL